MGPILGCGSFLRAGSEDEGVGVATDGVVGKGRHLWRVDIGRDCTWPKRGTIFIVLSPLLRTVLPSWWRCPGGTPMRRPEGRTILKNAKADELPSWEFGGYPTSSMLVDVS
jgi:hypothetical protein